MDKKINKTLSSFDEPVKKNILSWLNGPYDEKTKEEIKYLLQTNPKALINAFFKPLSFGTAGAREIMGVGTNRLNRYTIHTITQGLANYLKKEKKEKKEKSSVIIGYDNRNNSRFFAEETAKVLAGNGFYVYLFQALRPTPLVSFGCRYKHCAAAVMITASHNTPEYNGYKVYWSDGGQVIPPHDEGIMEEVKKITSNKQIKISEKKDPLISSILTSIDEAYLKRLNTLVTYDKSKSFGKDLSIVYTNLHGTGITIVPKALKERGFTNLSFVEEQKVTSGDFPFAPHPNPEEREALSLGIEKMLRTNGDILIANDPDADRMAVVVNHKNTPYILTGNQLASLFVHHICEMQKTTLPKNSAFIKSIVTTELFKVIVESFHMKSFDVLTGFKYIAEKIDLWEKNKDYKFIFGAEESYGYLFGDFVRDKDAISASCLIAEIALLSKKEEKTLLDVLYSLYKKYGIYREKIRSISFSEGKEGMEKMKNLMEQLRKKPPQAIANCSVAILEDYQTGLIYNLKEKKKKSLSLPKSNVLVFHLEDATKLTLRPSGTEPKIKIYGEVHEENFSSLEEGIKICDERLIALIDAIEEEII